MKKIIVIGLSMSFSTFAFCADSANTGLFNPDGSFRDPKSKQEQTGTITCKASKTDRTPIHVKDSKNKEMHCRPADSAATPATPDSSVGASPTPPTSSTPPSSPTQPSSPTPPSPSDNKPATH